jgi:hypothetical protein
MQPESQRAYTRETQEKSEKSRLSSNSNLNLNTSLNVDNDLLNSLGRSEQAGNHKQSAPQTHSQRRGVGSNSLNQTLVNPHLKLVPGLGTLTVRCLTGRDVQGLRREPNWALNGERLGARALDQLLADLLQRGDLAGAEGDADLVDFLK